MKWITLGTSHGATEKDRSCSANLLIVNDSYYIFDCGSSVERELARLELPIENVRCAFISHMHEDHVGALSAVAKRFSDYMKNKSIKIFMPEQTGIELFKKWLLALHLHVTDENVQLSLIEPKEIYSDENITVTAIRTNHVVLGEFPSYAFMVEAEGKRLLYTGDLIHDFSDYPAVAFQKDFDLIVSELVHFNPAENIDTIIKSRTKKLVFTHLGPWKIPAVIDNIGRFPFEVVIAEDHMQFEI